MVTDNPEEQPIAISLAPRHWVLILGCLNDFIHTHVGPRLDKLREAGTDPQAVSAADRTIIAGSVIAQGIIIKELTAQGIMKEEANEKLGVDALMRRLGLQDQSGETS